MADRNDGEREPSVERDEFGLRGDFGPTGSWCKFGDRIDYTRDYECRYCVDEVQSEDWGQHPDWGNDLSSEHYSGGSQTYSGTRTARR
jgi:hypothetical protein